MVPWPATPGRRSHAGRRLLNEGGTAGPGWADATAAGLAWPDLWHRYRSPRSPGCPPACTGSANRWRPASRTGPCRSPPGRVCDWFIDPRSGRTAFNAPALVGSLEGNFTLSARVETEFRATFDAGALMLWQDERTWAKLAFEISPAGQPMVVSVVTRGESDDCNSMAVNDPGIRLRVACIDGAYAFHASATGRDRQFVRHFKLPAARPTDVGFEVQAPVGEGCRARFSQIAHSGRTLTDLRNGD